MEWEVSECREMGIGSTEEWERRRDERLGDLMEGSEKNSRKRKRKKKGKWKREKIVRMETGVEIRREFLWAGRRTETGREDLRKIKRMEKVERLKEEWKERRKEKWRQNQEVEMDDLQVGVPSLSNEEKIEEDMETGEETCDQEMPASPEGREGIQTGVTDGDWHGRINYHNVTAATQAKIGDYFLPTKTRNCQSGQFIDLDSQLDSDEASRNGDQSSTHGGGDVRWRGVRTPHHVPLREIM